MIGGGLAKLTHLMTLFTVAWFVLQEELPRANPE